MKVLIVNNMVPFIWGGAEELAVNLEKNIHLAGHEAEILRIPFKWEPFSYIPSQISLVRSLELDNVDRVICLKFPAYFVRHPNKIIWLVHQYRQAYDLYDSNQTNIPSTPLGHEIQNIIRNSDNNFLAEAKRIYSISNVTRNRLLKYNGIDSKVLPTLINDPEKFHGGENKGYIFAGGRINDLKRQYLLLEALSLTPKEVRLIIAGPPDSPNDAAKLVNLVEQLRLKDRVKLDLRFLPRNEYADYVNSSLAVAYIPFDEESLGFVTMEGAIAKKALITTNDSGDVLKLVLNGVTGWVTEPDSASIAKAMTDVYFKIKKTLDLGNAASEHWSSLGLNWPNTVEELLK